MALLGWNRGFRHFRDPTLERKINGKPEVVPFLLEIPDHVLARRPVGAGGDVDEDAAAAEVSQQRAQSDRRRAKREAPGWSDSL